MINQEGERLVNQLQEYIRTQAFIAKLNYLDENPDGPFGIITHDTPYLG